MSKHCNTTTAKASLGLVRGAFTIYSGHLQDFGLQGSRWQDVDNIRLLSDLLMQNSAQRPKSIPNLARMMHCKQFQLEFLDRGVLTLLKKWLEPLPDGSLPNINI
ncbi:hypothetical protein L1987_54476 [Smallanthus sonchifolius]|uniref:Uncharacterized protein n=1 Tax=Smallanthus sonchifolius TaxID=185202 RepID=A0ACB9E6Q9_9ASTR|nr:hypothetical protein L1987_54476 [Smallanthus sonchifolius]